MTDFTSKATTLNKTGSNKQLLQKSSTFNLKPEIHYWGLALLHMLFPLGLNILEIFEI